jgi:RNA polymerase sigma-70 factor (ECF subfamily)
MTDLDRLAADLDQGRERFLELVADVRPDLHRYCARMTGSIAAGEDVVQETLAHAYYALPEIHALPPLRSWLFQIAHRRCIDYLRRYDRRMGQPLETVMHSAADAAENPEDVVAREEATRAAISAFLDLAPAPRSCVVLKDVLGHSVEEVSELLGLTVPAVKAALHRGRKHLREREFSADRAVMHRTSPEVIRYAALFNARDWDGVRALLAEDVRLDLVQRSQRSGHRDVSGYLTKYSKTTDWHFVPAWLEGREVLAAFRNPGDARPGYFVELTIIDGRVAKIRDFRYVPYIAAEAAIELAPTASFAGRS